MNNKIYLYVAVFLILFSVSCKEDEEMNPNASFTVTIQNVSEGKTFFNAGNSEAVPPGGSYSFSFHAGKGHFLSFATMFAQSNDLFYAPDESGIELYDGSGNPLTGDITSMVYLWDAGTEVNQEPGVGSDQAPRQSGPDTGTDENGEVMKITDVNDGFMYPANSEVLNVMLEHDGGTMFTVTIQNISDMHGFQTPLAPGSWVVHGSGQPLFTIGSAASAGLEDLAEDGVSSTLSDDFALNSGFVTPFAPGVWAVFNMENPVYMIGQQATAELEALAEDGDPSGYVNSLSGISSVRSYDVFTTPMGAGSPAPIFPNEQYSFEFDAQPGDKLSFATMMVQSNDLFAGAEVDLFPGGAPLSGDITSQIRLYDAMTEVNEFPGAGNDQAPRQTGANTGASENGMVNIVSDAFQYPAISDMLRISISSNQN